MAADLRVDSQRLEMMVQSDLEDRVDLCVVEVEPERFADEPQHLTVVGVALDDEIGPIEVPRHRLVLDAVLGGHPLRDHLGSRELRVAEAFRAHLVPQTGEEVEHRARWTERLR